MRSDEDALEISRRAARAPAYALRGEHRFGSTLRVQRWERTGLLADPLVGARTEIRESGFLFAQDP